MKLTNTDYKAIDNMDGEYLRIKARLLENDKDEKSAKEYLVLGALLGDNESIGSLGEYYLNNGETSLALGYFSIGANSDDVLSLYNLGNIYYEGKGVDKDTELGHYYYAKAIELVEDDTDEQVKYPSLFYNVAKDIIENALSIEPLFQAYHYLVIAGDGYAQAIGNGNNKYEKLLKEVMDLMNSDTFKEVREITEHDECCDDDCDGECHCHH